MFNRYDNYSEIETGVNGVPFQSGLPFMDWLYSGTIVYHKVKQNEVGRPDLIAWKYFNDSTMYPVIMWLNNFRDPICDISLNRDIAIPVDVVTASTFMPFTYVNET